MQLTRQQILDHLHREHSGTVKELADLLAMTPTGVRQHLAILEREGLIAAEADRGHVGRPAFIYRLTDTGEALYPKQYDVLVNLLMEEIRQVAGADILQRILRRVADRMAQRQQARVEGKSIGERVQVIAELMREQGCVATVEERDGVHYLHECTCPYPAVARKNSAICALEVDLVRRLTGCDARLVSSLLRGDAACVYRVRPLEEPQKA
ncbi:MAG: helix-turn-helix transcriptional regulator [Dehalococcoidia bacterium]